MGPNPVGAAVWLRDSRQAFFGLAERFGSGVDAFGHILYRIPLGFLDHILHILRPRTFVWVGFLEGLCHSSNILC